MTTTRCLLLLFLCALPSVFCQLVGPEYQATTFVTQVTQNAYGPIGLIFQRDGTLWADNIVDGFIYHYSATGQLLSQSSQSWGVNPRGMAFSKTERLYICILDRGLIEWSTTTNSFLRDVVSVPCLGMVCDPISGDLFITNLNGPTVYRVSNYETGTPSVSVYYNSSIGSFFDGIAVNPTGKFYLAHYGATDGQVFTITGVNDPTPGVGTAVAPVPALDGISVGVNLFDVEYPPYVIANNNDGTLAQVDLTANPPTVSTILSGGTRGDFSVVGYDGCIYATQSATIVKISDSSGNCLELYPTCPNQVPKLTFQPPDTENVTLGSNYCVQLKMSDNPESLSWKCEVDWGDFTPAENCSITQNPETISLCHTYSTYFAGFTPITVTVTDDQRFPSAARKFIQLFTHDKVSGSSSSSAPPATSTSSSASSLSPPSSSSSPKTSTASPTSSSSASGISSETDSSTISASGKSSGVSVTGVSSESPSVIAATTSSSESNDVSSEAAVVSSSLVIAFIAVIAQLR